MDDQVNGRGLGKDQDKEMNRISLLQSHHTGVIERVMLTVTVTISQKCSQHFFSLLGKETEAIFACDPPCYLDSSCTPVPPTVCVPTTPPNSERCTLHRDEYFPEMFAMEWVVGVSG